MQQAWRVAPHVHWRRFDDELVVLDLDGGQYYGLNEVAAAVFERVANGDDLPAIVGALQDVYDVDRPRLESDLNAVLDDLVARGILERAAGAT